MSAQDVTRAVNAVVQTVSRRLAPRGCENRNAVNAGDPTPPPRPRPSGTAPVVRHYAAQVVQFSAALDKQGYVQ